MESTVTNAAGQRWRHHFSYSCVNVAVFIRLHNLPNTSLASPEMDFGLWKEPKVIIAGVLVLFIARAMHKRSRTTGRPPVVSYAVPWVGSALDLGKSPDAFFKRAMYVE